MAPRNSPISQSQKLMVGEFLKMHPQLVRGTFTPTFTYKRAQELWEEIGEKLNAVPGGALKDWKKWRKTWQDLKKITKTKLVAKKKDMTKTGGGPPEDIIIDDNIADLIQPTEIEGHVNVEEPQIFFEFSDVERFDEELPGNHIPETESKHEQIEELILGALEENNEEMETETQEADHGYSMKYLDGLPKKKITQTKRLQTSIKLGQQLIKGLNSRTDLMETYYLKKMTFMDNQTEHNKKMLEAVKKNTEAMLALLATTIPK